MPDFLILLLKVGLWVRYISSIPSPAIKEKAQLLPEETQLRRLKYVNNQLEQDRGASKPRVAPGLRFGSLNTALRATQL